MREGTTVLFRSASTTRPISSQCAAIGSRSSLWPNRGASRPQRRAGSKAPAAAVGRARDARLEVEAEAAGASAMSGTPPPQAGSAAIPLALAPLVWPRTPPWAWTASPAVPASRHRRAFRATVRCAPCRAVGDGGVDLDDRVVAASRAPARPPASPGPPRWWARPSRCRFGVDRVGGASSAPIRRRGRAQGRPADGAERVARSQPARPAGPPSRPDRSSRP